MRFRNSDGATCDYIDITNKCTEEQYNAQITLDDKIPYSEIKTDLEKRSNVKHVSSKFDEKQQKEVFNNNVLTYFPAYRYENPGYLNNPYDVKLNYKLNNSFSNEMTNPIEVVSGLNEIANWMMDIVLDAQLYKQGNDGLILGKLNQVVSAALSSKPSTVRIGIGQRREGSTRLSIVDKVSGSVVYPSIFNLSTGELSVICLFCEIIRQSDRIPFGLVNKLGIVLIDEVDKHLHIKLQKEILPKMFALFPSIQFIVSSHSPFLNMGLAEEMPERSKIIDLDNNGITCSPTNNALYKEVYEMMIGENNRFAEKYKELEEKIKSGTKPLIITEGKTDIKHILKAKDMLNITDVDVDCIATECQPDGDTNLMELLEQLSKVCRPNKVIGIFDRDNKDKIVNKIETAGTPFKNYGNGVFAFCIQPPQSRIERRQTAISIEYLYSDDEIKTPLGNGCRLFFGTEFAKSSMYHNTESLTLKMPKGKGEDKVLENNGGQAVYDIEEVNHLAKKDDFAEAIKNNKIDISRESWGNFNHIFEKIRTILSL